MDCTDIVEIGYDEFARQIMSKLRANRIPYKGDLELTARCNLRCAHCYINLPASDQAAATNELSYNEICQLIDEMVQHGCLCLLLTGGEPLIRKDFLDIYTYAKKQGLIIILFTNATLITSDVADYLREWPPYAVEVTLYGRTKETYERVTGVPGSYERCMHGIDLLLERKLNLRLKTVVMTLNQHEIWDIKAFAEELGLDFRYDAQLTPGVDGSKTPCSLRLPPKQVAALDLADQERLNEWKRFVTRFWGPPASNQLYNCGAGLITFHIDPFGGMHICGMVRSSRYDLRQGSFGEGWFNFIPAVRQQTRTKETRCASCEMIALCGQCPGWSGLEHGDDETPVDYLCQIAHLRARVLRQPDVKGDPSSI